MRYSHSFRLAALLSLSSLASVSDALSDAVATLEADFEARKALRLAFDPDAYMKESGVDARGVLTKGQMMGTTRESHVYDAHEPEWACPDDEIVPRGRFGDGHKWVCGLRLAPPAPPCLIYSFGSAGEDSWERAMAARLPACEIHIFDPSLGAADAAAMRTRVASYNATFHLTGITGSHSVMTHEPRRRTARKNGWKLQTLAETQRELGHVGRRISYLKVDVEASEWGVFLGPQLTGKGGLWSLCEEAAGAGAPALRIDHLNIEMHAAGKDSKNAGSITPHVLARFFQGADACGLRTFHREPMWFLPPGLAEFALVHASVVRRIYRALGLTGWKHAVKEQRLAGNVEPSSVSGATSLLAPTTTRSVDQGKGDEGSGRRLQDNTHHERGFAVRRLQEEYDDRGFMVMPSLLPRSYALAYHDQVKQHVAAHGERYVAMMGGRKTGGWYIGDLTSIDELRHVVSTIKRSRRLRSVLTSILGEDFRLLSRSELYVDKAGYWHTDALYGALGMYYRSIPFIQQRCGAVPAPSRESSGRAAVGDAAGERCVARVGDAPSVAYKHDAANNESQRVATVAVYFQDHMSNDGGLSVIPGTHKGAAPPKRLPMGENSERKYANRTFERDARLHYSAGDAIVFDARLIHRGISPRIANVKHDVTAVHRIGLSLTFGRNNAFSEALDRGFAMRGRLHTFNSSVCYHERLTASTKDVDDSMPCRWEAVREDLRRRPLTGRVEVDADEADHTRQIEDVGRQLSALRPR